MKETGYAHPGYAASLSEFGDPRHLCHCGGWALERSIQGTSLRDAMGCYPLFTCSDWSMVHKDFEEMREDLVAFSCVLDPFGDFDLTYVERCFDICIPYKDHYVLDLMMDPETYVSGRHRKRARQALRRVSVEVCADPALYVDEWTHLYGFLVERHSIRGIGAFSRESFARQLQLPGAVLLLVRHEGATVGGNLFFQHNDVAYGHLSAFSTLGYEVGAPYAVKWAAIEYFTNRTRWIDLGGVPGVKGNEESGLAFFKGGWSSGTRMAYFCGAILNPAVYEELSVARYSGEGSYFPKYRQGEFR